MSELGLQGGDINGFNSRVETLKFEPNFRSIKSLSNKALFMKIKT